MKKFLKELVAWFLFVFATVGIIVWGVEYAIIAAGLWEAGPIPQWDMAIRYPLYILALYGWWKLK